MSTLADARVVKECSSRLERLTPHAPRSWGRMTAHQMICHLSDSFSGAMGEMPVSPAPGPLPRKLMKWFGLHTPMRWPRNLKTRPEVEQGLGGTPPGDWLEDLSRLRQLIAVFPQQRNFAPHPIFGPMSWSEWQIWGYRHVDHHLRQFGV